MINVFDVAITPKRVFWTVTAVSSAYAVYKMPIFRWMRKKRLTLYSAFFLDEDSYDDSISHWLNRRCRSVFASLSSSSSVPPLPPPSQEQSIQIYVPTKMRRFLTPKEQTTEVPADLEPSRDFWRSMKVPANLEPSSSFLIPHD
jgi:hypothetical protein